MPTSHEAVREEIKYWQEHFNEGGAGAIWKGQVRQRLEALYALDRASDQPTRAPLSPTASRVRSTVRKLVQVVVWISVALKAFVWRRREQL